MQVTCIIQQLLLVGNLQVAARQYIDGHVAILRCPLGCYVCRSCRFRQIYTRVSSVTAETFLFCLGLQLRGSLLTVAIVGRHQLAAILPDSHAVVDRCCLSTCNYYIWTHTCYLDNWVSPARNVFFSLDTRVCTVPVRCHCYVWRHDLHTPAKCPHGNDPNLWDLQAPTKLLHSFLLAIHALL